MGFASIVVSIVVKVYRSQRGVPPPNHNTFDTHIIVERIECKMKLYSPKEMGKIWGVTESLVRRYCRDGRIPSAIIEDGGWLIPEGTPKPQPHNTQKPTTVLTSLAKRALYEHSKNNHHGIYEYIQVNLAYSSSRMASNRLTRKQVIEVYRTDKISPSFEPVKVDDLIEMENHFICMRYIFDTLTVPLTQSYIKRLHTLLTYGTFADKKHQVGIGEFRTKVITVGNSAVCMPKLINKELGVLIKDYEERKAPYDLERIIDFHVQFEKIHPFDDYNGRVGRAIMMRECIRRGITPFIIGDKNRSVYHKGIVLWDSDHTILLELAKDEQQRFDSKRELCKLMQYHKGPIY